MDTQQRNYSTADLDMRDRFGLPPRDIPAPPHDAHTDALSDELVAALRQLLQCAGIPKSLAATARAALEKARASGRRC